MTATTIAVNLVVGGVIVSLTMILYFLWLVYERGGPKHVGDVTKALRVIYDPNWPTKLLGYLPNVDADDEQDIDRADELPQPHHRTQSAEALGTRGRQAPRHLSDAPIVQGPPREVRVHMGTDGADHH